jgi:predicted nucleotide-binding protein
MYQERTADGQQVGPVYSHPTIATIDIDIWLDRDGGNHKVSVSATTKEKGLIDTLHGGHKLTPDEIIAEIERYEKRLTGILSRFRGHDIRSLGMAETDADIYPQLVIEIAELFGDAIGRNSYTTNIMNWYNTSNASFGSVRQILAVIRAAHTRITRHPEILLKKQADQHTRQREHVFIIHGRDEAKWRELKDMIGNIFRLYPIVLTEQPDIGRTVIEKFEHYAETCSYAIALFTPDDEVRHSGDTYLQARPNVIYELGWFCGRLSRSSTMLLLKQGTSMSSDFGGIIQKRFKTSVSELEGEIRKDLTAAGILEQTIPNMLDPIR